jgi:cysteine-rich repeat protein
MPLFAGVCTVIFHCIKLVKITFIFCLIYSLANCTAQKAPSVDAKVADSDTNADVTVVDDRTPDPKIPVDTTTDPSPVPVPIPVPTPVDDGTSIADTCGDDTLDADEECDDGNNDSGDGCSANCIEESCGDSIVNNSDENCDDGNNEDNDGCDNDCQTEFTFIESARSTFDVGSTHTCYKADNLWQLKCFGSNNQGELGQENTEEVGNGIGPDVADIDPVDIGKGISTALVVAGGNNTSHFTCVVTSSGTLKCFGDNSSGQLGKGNTQDLGDDSREMGKYLSAIALGSGREVQDVDAGGKHVCAILDNASLKCFGDNAYGQLGQGSTENLGDETGEMGNDLAAVDLGTNRTALHVALGEDFSCAILDDDTLKCFGRNDAGQLGQANTLSLGDGANEMGTNLTAISLGTGRSANKVATGAKHVCVILDNATLKCFGDNSHGQLGQGNSNNLGDDANEMGDNLAAVDLGTGRTALQVASGDYHSCALLDNHKVKCFGANASGQLGQESTDDLGDDANEMGDDLSYIDLGTGRTATAIAAGGSTTCVVLDNDKVKCFGENHAGQLGLGDTEDRGDETSEMGNDLDAMSFGF